MSYEYLVKSIIVPAADTDGGFSMALTEMSTDGWEMVEMNDGFYHPARETTAATYERTFVFRRPKRGGSILLVENDSSDKIASLSKED